MIEEVIKRAAVDKGFREKLLTDRSIAAAEAGIELTVAEREMMDSYPEAWLLRIIESTHVPDHERRRFLGKAAAVVATTISAGMVQDGVAAGKSETPKGKGEEPDDLLEELKKIEKRVEAIRKRLQKTGVATIPRKKAEPPTAMGRHGRILVRQDMPVMIAGLMSMDDLQPKPLGKSKEQQKSDGQKTKRLAELEKVLSEIQKEIESAKIEIQLKKRELE